MKATFKVIIWMAIAITTLSSSVGAFSAPLKEISTWECSKKNFDKLDDSCKQQLPHLTPDMYSQQHNNIELRRIYSVLW